MPCALVLLAAALADRPVGDGELRDGHGRAVRLSELTGGRPAVVVFLGVDCPLANLYAPRLKALAREFPPDTVRFLAVDPNDHDDPTALAAFARTHGLAFPCFHDPGGRVAGLLGATRTPQTVVLDAGGRVRYRGRIDDQYGVGGTNRGRPTRHDLAEAVREVLAGRPVSVPATRAFGCVIGRPTEIPAEPPVTYSRDIAPILATNCRPCHRPGEIGPFPLLTFGDARDHAGTILDVIDSGLMPPWHAASGPIRFANERRLTDEQKRVIAEWVRLGCPEGERSGVTPVAEPPGAAWALGTPDAVYQIPTEFRVPAEGIVEYQHFVVDPRFTADTWVRAAEVRPGNRRVVHHCTVFLTPPASWGTDGPAEFGALGSHNLIAFTPGSGPVRFPEGMAKRIPAGWRLHFVLHYAPIGTPQTDRTELALQFADPAAVRKEVGTHLVNDDDLVIPPHAIRHTAERTWTADRDYLLLALLPHMHLRGKSFRYTADYPDGTSEILLDVPRYDFNWQHRYELAEQKRLPAGTVVRCTAVYDNSAGNPFNPDPAATVRAGEQTTDEMLNGYLDLALADQDLVAERAAAERTRRRSLTVLVVGSLLLALCGSRLWWGGRGRPGAGATGPPA